jgi:hypothetical protein
MCPTRVAGPEPGTFVRRTRNQCLGNAVASAGVFLFPASAALKHRMTTFGVNPVR